MRARFLAKQQIERNLVSSFVTSEIQAAQVFLSENPSMDSLVEAIGGLVAQTKREVVDPIKQNEPAHDAPKSEWLSYLKSHQSETLYKRVLLKFVSHHHNTG